MHTPSSLIIPNGCIVIYCLYLSHPSSQLLIDILNIALHIGSALYFNQVYRSAGISEHKYIKVNFIPKWHITSKLCVYYFYFQQNFSQLWERTERSIHEGPSSERGGKSEWENDSKFTCVGL